LTDSFRAVANPADYLLARNVFTIESLFKSGAD
jgi:hypothetical protein